MKYFLGFLAVVTLVVLVFILVLKGFSGPAKPKNAINLLDYANSKTVVRLFVEGRVTADNLHRSYRITIGRDANTIEVMNGYKYEVVNAQTYANNNSAYADFLRALQLLNFTKGNPDPKLADTRGYCPNGSRYSYEIETAGQEVQHYWTTSCGGGTFHGNSSAARTLFMRQIPDFNKLTAGVQL
ncbi:MAG TPA: hypothetical protein VLH86_01105 [Patescibacteria group bacterium]|nr:hypothetical protein [Patescibacteria group bacterium]